MNEDSGEKNPVSFKKILFCTDFSQNSAKAFKFAVRSAVRNDGFLYILHVMPEPDAQFWKGYVYEDGQDLENKALSELKTKVSESYIPQLPCNVKYETVFRVGNAAQQIIDFARDNSVDLVVMGRQGAGAVRSILFGNVATKVSRNIQCPILIVP